MDRWISVIAKAIVIYQKKNIHSEEGAQIRGWLLKQDHSGGLITKWRRRWFHVEGDQLVYWKTEQQQYSLGRENPPLGSISLRNVSSVEPALIEKPNVFKITMDDTSYLFQCDSELSLMKWIAGLIQIVCRISYEDMQAKELAKASFKPVALAKPLQVYSFISFLI